MSDPPPPSARAWSGGVHHGSIQVAGQKIQVGVVHARKLVTVALDEHTVTVYDNDAPIKAVPRRITAELNRTKAHHEIARGA